MSEDNRVNDELLAEMLDLARSEMKVDDPMGYFERRGIPRDEARALFAAIGEMVAERGTVTADRLAGAATVGFIVGWQLCAGRLSEATS